MAEEDSREDGRGTGDDEAGRRSFRLRADCLEGEKLASGREEALGGRGPAGLGERGREGESARKNLLRPHRCRLCLRPIGW